MPELRSGHGQCPPSAHRQRSAAMSDLDEHNPFQTPFQTDADDAHSDPDSPANSNSNSNVDLSSEPATPPAHPTRILASPPSSPGINRGFASGQSPTSKQAVYKAPQPAFKSDFCCARDRWLHSGEDVEIQVLNCVN